MSDDFVKTVRIKRPSRVAPDQRGRNVWVGPVEEVELELVSTTGLEKILKSGDGKTQVEIRKLAAGRKDGILARDTATGVYQIVSKKDLEPFREGRDETAPAERGINKAAPLSDEAKLAAAELSLVSTQILRKVVKDEDQAAKPGGPKKDKFGGFDPYNSS